MPIMIIFHTGIELVSETTKEESKAAEGDAPDLVSGLKVAYTVNAPAEVSSDVSILLTLFSCRY